MVDCGQLGVQSIPLQRRKQFRGEAHHSVLDLPSEIQLIISLVAAGLGLSVGIVVVRTSPVPRACSKELFDALTQRQLWFATCEVDLLHVRDQRIGELNHDSIAAESSDHAGPLVGCGWRAGQLKLLKQLKRPLIFSLQASDKLVHPRVRAVHTFPIGGLAQVPQNIRVPSHHEQCQVKKHSVYISGVLAKLRHLGSLPIQSLECAAVLVEALLATKHSVRLPGAGPSNRRG
mmetsp:Transcript_973/g.1985  ORF Transcript_973/g.1985 Transcript_973/m.1985 type:complete len:232 (+) Transcript_973:494-1189(+)